jgi:hypothetical protein
MKNIIFFKKDTDTVYDWIINSYDPNDKIIFVRLYCAQILFILENLKNGGNCIIKCQLPILEKIFMDLYYIMYIAFEKIIIVRPSLSMFSPEFYIVGLNYDNLIIKQDQFNTLFQIIDEPVLGDISVIKEYSIDFVNSIIHHINIIYNDYCEFIKNKIFYVDLWEQMDDNTEKEIKRAITQHNYLYVKKYFKRKQ